MVQGVTNAFLILGLIRGIWSIMAVEFFGDGLEPPEKMINLTPQDYANMFGQFSFVMLTMFQVTTFDSWASGVARLTWVRSAQQCWSSRSRRRS